MMSKKLLRACGPEYIFVHTYSIVASVVRVTVCRWIHIIPCAAIEHYHVQVESSQANEGLPQLFLSAKPKKAAAGKDNCAN